MYVEGLGLPCLDSYVFVTRVVHVRVKWERKTPRLHEHMAKP
jgi:hypothetical protein